MNIFLKLIHINFKIYFNFRVLKIQNMCPRVSDMKYILGVEGRLGQCFRFGHYPYMKWKQRLSREGESKAEEIKEQNSKKQHFLE